MRRKEENLTENHTTPNSQWIKLKFVHEKHIFRKPKTKVDSRLCSKNLKKLYFYEFHLWLRQKKTYRILNWHSFHPVGIELQIHILIRKNLTLKKRIFKLIRYRKTIFLLFTWTREHIAWYRNRRH